MILDFISGDYIEIISRLTTISILWVLVFLSIIVDFIFGVRAAKKLGEVRTSEGFRRSIEKFAWYFGMLFFSLLLDAMLPISHFFKGPWKFVPVASLLSALALVATEMKSVWEKGDKKLRRRTDASLKQIIKIIKRNPKVVDRVMSAISEEEKVRKKK